MVDETAGPLNTNHDTDHHILLCHALIIKRKKGGEMASSIMK